MKDKKPNKVALYGMDGRSYKTMVMYLQGPCKGIVVVVDELDAEIDIIDADSIKAKEILQDRKAKNPERPVILLSLQELTIEGSFYVKKPVQAGDLIKALQEAKQGLDKGVQNQSKDAHTQVVEQVVEQAKKQVVVEHDKPINIDVKIEKKQQQNPNIDTEEKKKIAKHRSAMDLTEGGFSSYIGHVEGIDFSDHEQMLAASYNPKNFFLGYVQAALNAASEKARIMQLNSGWKPLIIFPHSREIWLNADDKQLRAFAGLVIRKESGKAMSLSPIDQQKARFNENMESFYDIDAFLWKLAIWTSKGRYPNTLNISMPVYLMRWPNFTRLIVTPHALRIAALLIEEPRTALNIASALNIKPQYVFVFISAAHAVGLVGQAKRKADQMVVPEKPKASKSKGLLSKILGRLRSEGK